MDYDNIKREIGDLLEENEQELIRKVRKLLKKADEKDLRDLSDEEILDMIGELRW